MSLIPNDILAQIEKPARYIGSEFNAVQKDRRTVSASIALIYPDLYDVGMSYYGFQILYHLLNRATDIAAERAYVPWHDYARYLRERGLTLTSLETHTPLSEFDVVGFTLPYELTYTNILEVLSLAGINLLAAERSKAEPLIIGGGSGAFNPEPLAPFFDLFVIGDGEEIVVPLVRFIARERCRLSRLDLLRAVVEHFPGVYVPRFYQPDDHHVPRPTESFAPPIIKAHKVTNLKPEYYPACPLMPLIAIAQDRLVVELMRGCTEGCRFCQAGMLYRPVRERPMGDVYRQIAAGLAATGYDEVGLLSLSTSDYRAIAPLLGQLNTELAARSITLSYPSLRLDSFTELLAKAGRAARKSGLTFAPEAGSERLRRVINKQISAADLLTTAGVASQHGWQLLKLYFMLGLPTETDEDLIAISELCRQVILAGERRLSLNLTLATFIPKPFTPFQWEAMLTATEIQRRLDLLKPLLRRQKGVKVMGRDPRSSIIEALLARGDRRLSRVILWAWQNGARFDAWKEHSQPAIWEAALRENGLDIAEYLAARNITDPLPWSHIDCGIDQEYFQQERERAFQAATTPDCRLGCQGCGVCYPGGPQMLYAEIDEPLPTGKYGSEPVTEQPTRYLLHYRKFGRAVYIAHLDVMRVFQQSLRRAGIRPVMTQGFSPHPKLSAGHPLPLGYASEDELLELVLPQPCVELAARLNRHLPEGFEVWQVEVLPARAPAVFSRIEALEYAINLETLPPELDERIVQFFDAEEVVSERIAREKTTRINIRPFVASIRREERTLLVKTLVEAGRTVKIAEILRALGLADVNYRVVRKRSGLRPC